MTISKTFAIAVFACLLGSSQAYKLIASSRMLGTSNCPDCHGWVAFHEDSNKVVRAVVSLAGMQRQANSLRAMRIHELGDISNSNGSSMAGVFNPEGLVANCEEGTFGGVLGNVQIGADGRAKATLSHNAISLNINNNGLILGRGIAVHNYSQPLDKCPDAIQLGAVLSQGVIGYAPGSEVYNLDLERHVEPMLNEAKAVWHPIPGRNADSDFSGARGTTRFEQLADGVRVHMDLAGLPRNRDLGLHITEFASILEDNVDNLGNVWSPVRNAQHGCRSTDPARSRAGDLGNVRTSDSGTVKESFVLPGVNIFRSGINTLLGRAIVIHNAADDCSDVSASGVKGRRVAYGVIGASNAAFATAAALGVATASALSMLF
ncbi:hypothetical protein H696_05674 [Fonticula alba]|uniref:Superoxide dismutase copper/zinc binding domain-containing protein n=1 Tax=Fonticula alba TaxID=691883 RepID=A0A058Z122_FONAL|nr:hypothetical protein H696_05674 [Fonticula alba]KCV67949.1 hypothetical protein H696_05674 [Fonticula alba]|eukprot:XP_009497769.1 hypothetical protein H696_05674 [Fonticula alba]